MRNVRSEKCDIWTFLICNNNQLQHRQHATQRNQKYRTHHKNREARAHASRPGSIACSAHQHQNINPISTFAIHALLTHTIPVSRRICSALSRVGSSRAAAAERGSSRAAAAAAAAILHVVTAGVSLPSGWGRSGCRAEKSAQLLPQLRTPAAGWAAYRSGPRNPR